MTREPNDERITIRLPSDLLRLVEAAAEQDDRTPAQIIRLAIKRYFASYLASPRFD